MGFAYKKARWYFCFLHSVTRSKIFDEFSDEEKSNFFSLTDKKVCHHVDTLYYSVALEGDKTDNEGYDLNCLLYTLDCLKQEKLAHPEESLEYFDLEVSPIGFSIYQYHLALNESFDIFIAKNIPNDETPRICVQLRSRMLFLEGEVKSIEKSFYYVQQICEEFSLTPKKCYENRIDYAYHTNMIQSSAEFFSTEYLAEHLQSKLRLFHLIGNVSDTVEINTFQLGNRRSNNVFLRCYNKTREVIEKNYKSFFIEAWLEQKLISKYDYFCLKRAFEIGSYTTGLCVARCEWYIANGHDEKLKSELKSFIDKCYVKSDNVQFVEKKLRGVLPPVTVITNIEFQTKRAFYASADEFINEHVFIHKGDPHLERLCRVLSLKRTFLDYLTTKTVRFVKDKKARKKCLTDWWRRIYTCKIRYADDSLFDLYRDNERKSDMAKNKRRLLASIAKYNALEKQSLESRPFHEDISDVLSVLNDNDVHNTSKLLKDGKFPFMQNYQYTPILERTSRQYKGIIKKLTEEKKEKGRKEK